jgi:IS4 transposase
MGRFLPRRGLPLMAPGGKIAWTPRLLVICALLMFMSKAQSLKDRFDEARQATVSMYPSRKRPGKTFEGFIGRLAKVSRELLGILCEYFRQSVRQIAAAAHWNVEGWTLFAVDGTRVECPMTKANEKQFGCAGKSKTTPQQFLTMLLHLGTGLPWGWKIGPGTSSERGHLREMIPLLPGQSMLVADAGFVGYDLLGQILAAGHCFVIRVGSNVRLLKKLGFAVREYQDIVYLWPEKKRKRQAPMVLRLVKIRDGRKTVNLLCSVVEKSKLSDACIGRIYQRRWGIELYYRSMKQTMGNRKMLSDSPAHALVELNWCVAALWMLGLMTVSRLIEAGKSPGEISLASALRVVRQAMRQGRRCCCKGWVRRELAKAARDGYQRTRTRKARHWPHKKREKPPGQPKIKPASRAEIRLARQLLQQRIAA